MREDSRNYRPINLTSSRNTRVLGNHHWHEVQQRKMPGATTGGEVVLDVYELRDQLLESSSAKRNLEVLVDKSLNINQQCTLAAKRSKCILGWIKHSTSSWPKEVILLLYIGLMRS